MQRLVYQRKVYGLQGLETNLVVLAQAFHHPQIGPAMVEICQRKYVLFKGEFGDSRFLSKADEVKPENVYAFGGSPGVFELSLRHRPLHDALHCGRNRWPGQAGQARGPAYRNHRSGLKGHSKQSGQRPRSFVDCLTGYCRS